MLLKRYEICLALQMWQAVLINYKLICYFFRSKWALLRSFDWLQQIWLVDSKEPGSSTNCLAVVPHTSVCPPQQRDDQVHCLIFGTITIQTCVFRF